MRKPIIAGNWKMNKTVGEACELVTALKDKVADVTDVEIVVAPDFTALLAVAEVIRGSNIKLAAQDMYWEEEGAFTGEVSPLMLKDVGCQYVIIGHSERRAYFSETNETVNKNSTNKSPPPLLAGAVMRSILNGTSYPQMLQNAIINRIRADREINYIRAAIIKAVLVRKYRIYKQGMEVNMSLDKENKSRAYLLGRLFALAL